LLISVAQLDVGVGLLGYVGISVVSFLKKKKVRKEACGLGTKATNYHIYMYIIPFSNHTPVHWPKGILLSQAGTELFPFHHFQQSVFEGRYVPHKCPDLRHFASSVGLYFSGKN
jgi:hypothetical protein